MTSNYEIFFSYAWGDESDHSREKIVDELYHSLLKDNFRVIRDKYNLKYKGLITEFIARIGRGKFIIVAISEKYLKSQYCMSELYGIARNSNLDKENFTKKILPVMVEFVDFTKPATIEYYLSYWENEYKIWDNLLKTHSGNLSAEQLQRYHNVKLIFQNFGMVTEWITDMNTLTPQILAADNFAEIKNEIRKRSEELSPSPNGQGGRKWTVSPAPAIGIVAAFVTLIFAGSWLSDRWRSMQTQDDNSINESKTEKNIDSDTINQDAIEQSVKVPGPSSKAPITSKENPSVEVEPPVTDVEAAPVTCLVTCDTKGITGVEVSFIDEKNNKQYLKISDGGTMQFDIPCDLKEEYIRVSFRRGQAPAEYRNVQLKAFEIPEKFMTK
jgi:hypothetical protein